MQRAARELAARLGASATSAGHRVTLAQSGRLRTGEQSRWMRFTAHQWIALGSPAFSWVARTGPFGALTVRDGVMNGKPEAGLFLFGVVPLNRSHASDALTKGELMRYLAELPWAPDAILHNSQLRWEDLPNGSLGVTANVGSVDASVIFTLDTNGHVATVTAHDRPRQEETGLRERPWHGAFSDYRRVGSRWIPHAAEVGWEVAGRRFCVWQGRLERWEIAAPE